MKCHLIKQLSALSYMGLYGVCGLYDSACYMVGYIQYLIMLLIEFSSFLTIHNSINKSRYYFYLIKIKCKRSLKLPKLSIPLCLILLINHE